MSPFHYQKLFQTKIKGNALFYTILIALVIAIVCICFLSLFAFQKTTIDQLLLQNQLNLNLRSAQTLLLNSAAEEFNTPTPLSLFDSHKDSILLHKKRWGCFELGISEAFHHTSHRKESISRHFFIASLPSPKDQSSLLLEDFGNPLILNGNTKIVGEVYLPKSGVKTGFIDRKGYSGSKLIYGKKKLEKPLLPEIRRDFIAWISQHTLSTNTGASTKSVPDSLNHDFSNAPLIFHNPALDLSNKKIKGNVILIADDEILVTSNYKLEDAILFAPKITIESGFTGSLQAFATTELLVQDQVELIYPSAITILSNPYKKELPTLIIEKGAQVNGLVLGLNLYNANKKNANQILIKPGGLVMGQIFSNSICQIEGIIHGNVMARKLIFKNAAATYENYLVDAILEITKRPKSYLSPPIYETKTSNNILKWLN